MKKKHPIMRCAICERDDIPAKEMNAGGYACLPCERDYIAYRRAFKFEFGRWPTVKDFKSEDPPL